MKHPRSIAAASAGMLAAGTLATVALTPGTADAAPAPAVHVRVIHHHVHMTDVVRPGVRRFVIRSPRAASFQIIRKTRGYTERQLVHDVNTGMNGGNTRAIKRFERHVTLLGGIASSHNHPGTMWLNLPRGRYIAVDTNTHRTRLSQLFEFRVRGARVPGAMPAGRRITAIKETTWSARPKAIPTRGVLRFVNRSQDNHFIALAKLAPGKTVADFKAWIDATMQGQQVPPPIDMSAPEVDTGAVSPGHRFAFHYRLPKGHYILTCWWPDADMGGMPHAFMGMYRQLDVR
ncbi:MAG TPA: hypothetical protein VI452_11395 [Marmoricola sp.]